MIENPCNKCRAARFCTRRCYAWKDYNRSRKEKEEAKEWATRVWKAPSSTSTETKS